MYCCLSVNVLLFVCDCLVHVLLFVEWVNVDVFFARKRDVSREERQHSGLNVLLFHGYVNACMFLCMCWWLFDVFKDVDQEALIQDLKALLPPLAHDEAAKAECHRECFVYTEIIHVLMLFVFVLISGIGSTQLWWLPSHPHQEENHLDAHC